MTRIIGHIRKVTVPIVVLSALMLMGAADPKLFPAREATDVVIRVSSATPGREIDGGIATLADGSDSAHMSRQTPFELHAHAKYLVGIFGAKSSESPIRVEVVIHRSPGEPATSTSTGTTVIVHMSAQLGPFTMPT